ncbi:hypothetical protein D3C72_1495660 [compost metagenome]
MAGGLGQRAFLTPAGHAAVDQPGIVGQQHLRAQTQTLHDAGAIALDQTVGLADQFTRGGPALLAFEVQFDPLARARQHVGRIDLGAGTVDADDLGAVVGQHHAGEGTGTDAGHLDDGQTRQGAYGFRRRAHRADALADSPKMSLSMTIAPRTPLSKRSCVDRPAEQSCQEI